MIVNRLVWTSEYTNVLVSQTVQGFTALVQISIARHCADLVPDLAFNTATWTRNAPSLLVGGCIHIVCFHAVEALQSSQRCVVVAMSADAFTAIAELADCTVITSTPVCLGLFAEGVVTSRALVTRPPSS